MFLSPEKTILSEKQDVKSSSLDDPTVHPIVVSPFQLTSYRPSEPAGDVIQATHPMSEHHGSELSQFVAVNL
jgi:hypothetical protein